MIRFRRRDDALGLRANKDARFEALDLVDRFGFESGPSWSKLAHQGSRSVVAKATRVNLRRNEVVAERVHWNERRHTDGVAEIIPEDAARELRDTRWARSRGILMFFPCVKIEMQERKAETCEVRATAERRDDDVGHLARLLHLLDRLLTHHRLVREHVIEHAAEGVLRVFVGRRTLDGLGNRNAEAARATPGPPRESSDRRRCSRSARR